MAYVVHFLPVEPGVDWLDALEALDARLTVDHQSDAPVDIVRSDWWRIASLTFRVLPDAELRRTQLGLTFHDRASGLVLELLADEISLSLPYRHDERRAREVLLAARRIARFVEDETGLVAIDAQLGLPFLGSTGALDDGAALMDSTRRAIASGWRPKRAPGDAPANRPRVR
jgi:hypothetical protein